ncbi:MAG: DUF86 domain-containing protein [Candidatus Lokiarchaeota archaeon]|nr:DUF86 domain-containing protein [Candidatus Lokiarchaeota archaeon]
MDPARKKRYKEKLDKLDRYYSLLKEWLEGNKIDVLVKENKTMELFATYHSGQLVIEVITDLVAMIVKDTGSLVKGDYENFDILLEKKIISGTIHKDLKELNGLRNRLVHGYNGIVDQTAWTSLTSATGKIQSAREVIEKWLNSQSSSK